MPNNVVVSEKQYGKTLVANRDFSIGEGGGSLYSYRRSGNYSETKALVTTIDVAYFKGNLEEGMFIGGNTVSDYNEETGE